MEFLGKDKDGRGKGSSTIGVGDAYLCIFWGRGGFRVAYVVAENKGILERGNYRKIFLGSKTSYGGQDQNKVHNKNRIEERKQTERS